MPEFISSAGVQLPFILILLALLGYRRKVFPRASVFVNAPLEKVFDLVDIQDRKVQTWSRTTVTSDLIDAAKQVYRMTYVTTLSTGSQQSSHAIFSVAERRVPNYIELRREGLEGKSLNNELLKIAIETVSEAGGTRLRLAYDWGPRPFLAQVLARADLWGGAYRLKGLAETGIPDERTHTLISAGVSLVTGVLSLVGFGLMVGWIISGLLVVALAIHEFGHLLAFRLIGQPWGRMIFLPFLGAIAMPRLPYETQGQAVFAALMGPAFSALPAIGIVFALTLGGPLPDWLFKLGLAVTGLNLFNLLPLEPLDGGVALRSVLAKIMGGFARFGLLAIGALIVATGFYLEQVIFLVFGGISILANIRPRLIDPGLKPLTSLQVAISSFGFMAIVATYIIMLRYYLNAF